VCRGKIVEARPACANDLKPEGVARTAILVIARSTCRSLDEEREKHFLGELRIGSD